MVAGGILNGMSNEPANTVQTGIKTVETIPGEVIQQTGTNPTSPITQTASSTIKSVGEAIQSAMSVAVASPVVTGVAVLASVIVLTAVGVGVGMTVGRRDDIRDSPTGTKHFRKRIFDYCFIIFIILIHYFRYFNRHKNRTSH